jgi:putative addiction module component (TIGR02574 family)
MKTSAMIQMSRLSTEEKILLVEDIWDSIAAETNGLAVPESHRRELGKRLLRHRNEPGALMSLGELKRQIGKRRA